MTLYLFLDDTDLDLHTPLLDASPLSSPLITNESMMTAEDTDWSAMSAPPSEVTGQYREYQPSASVENTDGQIMSVKVGSQPPDILQKVVQIAFHDESPGPSRALPAVVFPAEPERDTDHTYSGQNTQDGLLTPVPAYENSTSIGSVDSTWGREMTIEEPKGKLTCVVENIEGCSVFNKPQSLHHVVRSRKFSFTANVEGELNNNKSYRYMYLPLIFSLEFPASIDEIFLKMELRRTNKKYDHIPINVVCEKHKNEAYNHPIQPLTDKQKYLVHGSAQLFKLGQFLQKEFQQKIEIMFPCPDTCSRGV